MSDGNPAQGVVPQPPAAPPIERAASALSGWYEVADCRRGVYVRAHGLASMTNCLCLRDFIETMLQEGRRFERFVPAITLPCPVWMFAKLIGLFRIHVRCILIEHRTQKIGYIITVKVRQRGL